MTDSPTPAEPGPVDPDVELASAQLDGEVGADERAGVDDAAVQAHRSAFARVSDQVRDVPPPPPGLVDDHVARALEAFDADDRVVPLRHRPAAQPWWQRIPLGAVAAALVVVALIGAVGLISTSDGGDDDTAAVSMDESSGDDRSDPSGGGESGSAEASDSAAATGEDSPALESQQEQYEDVGAPLYDSYEALAQDLRAELAPDRDDADVPLRDSDTGTTTRERTAEERGPGGDPCGAVGVLGLDPADLVAVRSAIVSGEAVTAVVHDTSDGRRLTVVEDTGCTVVLDEVL